MKSDDKREVILAAACTLFAERGFYGTQVEHVAARAKVGTGTVYRYFENKEALVNALFQHWKRELGRRMFEGHDPYAPPRRQFHDFWARMSHFTATHPEVVRFLEMHHHAAYLDQVSKGCEDEVHGPIIAFIRELQEREILKPVAPDIILGIVYGAFIGIAKAAADGHLPWTEETLETAENCVWEAIRR